MQLSEQENVRRASLQAIREMGVDPYPAPMFEVDFKTTDYTTLDFRKQMAKELEKIKGVGAEKAKQIRDFLLANKFRVAQILEKEEFQAFGLTNPLEFFNNRGTNHKQHFCTILLASKFCSMSF